MGVSFTNAKRGPDGYFIDEFNTVLPVSASDLERFTYCPMSWYLAKEGASGEGKAVQQGVEKHKVIHGEMREYQDALMRMRRSLIIWSWWFGIIIAFMIDAFAFLYIDDVLNSPIEFAKVLSMWSVSCLVCLLYTSPSPRD